MAVLHYHTIDHAGGYKHLISDFQDLDRYLQITVADPRDRVVIKRAARGGNEVTANALTVIPCDGRTVANCTGEEC